MSDKLRGTHATDILIRIFKPQEDNLSAEAARTFLQFRLEPTDRQRIHELLAKNQRGEVTAEEQQELDSYLRVGNFLDLLASKARRSLRRLGQEV